MQRYSDRDRDSGVVEYDIGDGYIDIKFNTGSIYRYTSVSAGPLHLQRMIELARSGEGLNAYINKHTKKRYSQRLR